MHGVYYLVGLTKRDGPAGQPLFGVVKGVDARMHRAKVKEAKYPCAQNEYADCRGSACIKSGLCEGKLAGRVRDIRLKTKIRAIEENNSLEMSREREGEENGKEAWT